MEYLSFLLQYLLNVNTIFSLCRYDHDKINFLWKELTIHLQHGITSQHGKNAVDLFSLAYYIFTKMIFSP